jgi:4'-phosphopantetheinyl transferase
MGDLIAANERIDLWVTSCHECDESLLEEYRGLLSEDERRTEGRFRFARDRRRYVATRALVRVVLSRYATTLPAAWRFTTNACGRPGIANQGSAERALSFNISHTTDQILLGVTRRRPIGVDIEAVRESISSEIGERFFTNDEVASLSEMTADLRVVRFFELWTLRESYIKARGLGLSLSLDSFRFDLSSDSVIRFALTAPVKDSNEHDNWTFWQLWPARHHVASVCTRGEPGLIPRLTLRKIIPLRIEESLSCVPSRESTRSSR